jgi:hypothetical protein
MGSEIFLDERCRKCPSDNVNNFVEIEKFFNFGKNYNMSEQNFLIFEKNYICGKILLSSEKIMKYPKFFLSRPTAPHPPPVANISRENFLGAFSFEKCPSKPPPQLFDASSCAPVSHTPTPFPP